MARPNKLKIGAVAVVDNYVDLRGKKSGRRHGIVLSVDPEFIKISDATKGDIRTFRLSQGKIRALPEIRRIAYVMGKHKLALKGY